MRSMTGYGEASGENARHGVTVSLRAVNHRFLDLQLRLAEDLRGSEAALRDLIAREVARGRLEARVEVRSVAERKATVEVHMGVIREAHTAIHQLVEALQVIESHGFPFPLPLIVHLQRLQRHPAAVKRFSKALIVPGDGPL